MSLVLLDFFILRAPGNTDTVRSLFIVIGWQAGLQTRSWGIHPFVHLLS